jgi:type IV pilus assembly protein PilO
LAPGLQKTSLLLTARGTGPQLLAFLRSLEQLSLLVVQSDLSLKHETKEAAKPGEAAANTTQLRLNLSLYSAAELATKQP